MCVCSFDMRFTYVMAGWEGTTNDSRIVLETASNPNNQEMRRRGGPKGREELFNYRHSNLRNIIERCFALIVIACCAIHNYIRMHVVDDYLFSHFEGGDDEAGTSEAAVHKVTNYNPTQVREMAEKRDTIANQMWSDYNTIN
ncbi:hypothetical protein LINGRAHAP2_LOCUS34622 [Linum grandiflorum]